MSVREATRRGIAANDGGVRGCVYGAARELVPYPGEIKRDLFDAIEETYQEHKAEITGPRGIDYRRLAELHVERGESVGQVLELRLF